SMLVYTRGQFFGPHQDSEKDDQMVASLVVTLPGTFTGGSLVVTHRGERTVYRSLKHKLSFVAFYSDCRHEVRSVRSGHRVVLTYNLMLADAGVGPAAPVPGVHLALADLLDKHFDTPTRSPWRDGEGPTPNRLVYLICSITSTPSAASTGPGSRAAMRFARRRCGLRPTVRTATSPSASPIFRRRGAAPPRSGTAGANRPRWNDYDDPDIMLDDGPADPSAYELEELLDSGITLGSCTDPSGAAAEPLVARVDDTEVCATTPSVLLEPYESEYEGYMGNYGNTMDRWYRRAAIVVWPRRIALEVHADHIRAGDVDTARDLAATLEPFWDFTARGIRQPDVVASALRVAADLDRADMAAMLLGPLCVEPLTHSHAQELVAVAARYGDSWFGALLAGWFTARSPRDHGQVERRSWVASLTPLCDALQATDSANGARIARLLLHRTWAWLDAEITRSRAIRQPSHRDQALVELAPPIAGFLAGVAVSAADDLREATVATLCADDALLCFLVEILRQAAKEMPPDALAAAGVDAMLLHCVGRLTARLARPVRDDDDWSIAVPAGCDCDLCATLGDFLDDPARRRFEWPIKQDSRHHVHSRIDQEELPVDHRTIRKGRPYTLVLTKTMALFEREEQARRRDEDDLVWLGGQLTPRVRTR
ncbi:MAG TPA: 2OG-Fe(II) oxygenase, partial [Aldersonia sp.]